MYKVEQWQLDTYYIRSLNNMDNYKAQIGHQTFNVSDTEVDALDLVTRDGTHYLLDDNENYKIEVISTEGKTVVLKVNNTIHTVELSDPVDQLVEKMGMDKPAEIIMTDVKAPMPGLILDIMVDAGTEVKAGDPLLILEAMKMENVIKAAGDGVVKSVVLQKGATVEKNEVILEME